ncbi:MAG: hypothetical protein ACYDBB_03840 [Armatimonadota bacterium]
MPWFTFRYATKDYNKYDQKQLERRGVTSDCLLDLFDCEVGYQKKQKVFSSFTREFADGDKWLKNIILGRWKPKQIVEKVQLLIRKHILNDPLAWTTDSWTGPSRPFQPAELKQWATTWHKLLRGMSDDERMAMLYEPDTALNKMGELEEITKFADMAQKDGVQIILEVKY